MPIDEAIFRPFEGNDIEASRFQYRDEDMIGSGAFAAVYKGRMRTANGKLLRCAIKKIKLLPPKHEQRQAWVCELEILPGV